MGPLSLFSHVLIFLLLSIHPLRRRKESKDAHCKHNITHRNERKGPLSLDLIIIGITITHITNTDGRRDSFFHSFFPDESETRTPLSENLSENDDRKGMKK